MQHHRQARLSAWTQFNTAVIWEEYGLTLKGISSAAGLLSVMLLITAHEESRCRSLLQGICEKTRRAQDSV